MKNLNNSHIAKVEPWSIAYHLLDFLPISALLIKTLLMKKAYGDCAAQSILSTPLHLEKLQKS